MTKTNIFNVEVRDTLKRHQTGMFYDLDESSFPSPIEKK